MLAPPRPWWDSVPIAFAWRYLCHSIMIGLALVNERRPAPNLPDLLLDLIPRVDWIARHNYHLWVACYLPLAFWLWRRDRAAFVHFLYVGGLLSLLRGVCIPLTGLGPVEGPDVNAGMSWATIGQAWWALVNPISALTSDAAHVHLTKDLFFSGHTATTFLFQASLRMPVVKRMGRGSASGLPSRPDSKVAVASSSLTNWLQ